MDAADILDAYLGLYTRRRRDRPDGSVFSADEPDALVALLVSRLGPGLRNDEERTAAVEALDAVSRGALEGGIRHSAAVDIAGLAWAEAYGVLALSRPPLEQLDWVLDRGRPSGSVDGRLHAAWRLLFLSRAIPLLSWRNRRVAETERDGWVRYLAERLGAAAAEQEVSDGLSAELRLACVACDAAAAAGAPVLVEAAAGYAAGILPRTSGRSLTTAQLCHVALVERALEGRAGASPTLERLLAERVRGDTSLLAVGDEQGAPAETSPWVPLTLVAHGAQARTGRRLRVWRVAGLPVG